MKLKIEVLVIPQNLAAGIYDFAEILITCRDGSTIRGWTGECSLDAANGEAGVECRSRDSNTNEG